MSLALSLISPGPVSCETDDWPRLCLHTVRGDRFIVANYSANWMKSRTAMSIQRSLLDQRVEGSEEARLLDTVATDDWGHGEDCSCDLAPQAAVGPAYNEDAFRYFLEIERKRSEISGRPFLLLLIDLKRHSESDIDARIDRRTADRLFSALSLCLRETDFIGWYREHRSIGAVLTQDSNAAAAGIPDPVARRVHLSLQEILPAAVAPRLQLRIYQLPATAVYQS